MSGVDMEITGVYLKPGELYVAERPTVVKTVLGSCIAVTMFCPKLKIGAICHAMLPHCGVTKLKDDSRFLYIDTSIHWMLDMFESAGEKKSGIEVKVFGGADVLDLGGPVKRGGGILSVGKQNIEATLNLIEEEGLSLLARDVGGISGRKLHFYTHTGEVIIKRLTREFNCIAETSRICKHVSGDRA